MLNVGIFDVQKYFEKTCLVNDSFQVAVQRFYHLMNYDHSLMPLFLCAFIRILYIDQPSDVSQNAEICSFVKV